MILKSLWHVVYDASISTHDQGDNAKYYRSITGEYEFAGIFVTNADLVAARERLGGNILIV